MSILAYIHIPQGSSKANEIFYVGKGSAKRSRNMSSRSDEHKAYAAKLPGVDVATLDCSSHEIAYSLEKGLIKCLRRMGAPLVNKTAGGGGLEGFTLSPEQRAKISIRQKGPGNPMRRPEVVAKVLATKAPTLKQSAQKSAQTRALPENRERISAAQKATWADPAIRERRLKGLLASGAAEKTAKRLRDSNPSTTPEGRKLRGEQSRKRWADPATREKIKSALAASWTPERKNAFSANNPSHRAEINAKKSAALKGHEWPRVDCPHCGASGAENIMKRWHFDRCRARSED